MASDRGCPSPAFSWWFGETGPLLRRVLRHEGDPGSQNPAAGMDGKAAVEEAAPAWGQYEAAKELTPPGEPDPLDSGAAGGADAWVSASLRPLVAAKLLVESHACYAGV